MGNNNRQMPTHLIPNSDLRQKISNVGVILGSTVARIVKDNIEDDYAGADKAFRVNVPVTAHTMRIMYVVGQSVNSEAGLPIPQVKLDLMDPYTKQVYSEMINPGDFWLMSKSTDSSEIQKLLNAPRKDLYSKIFINPEDAAQVIAFMNRAEAQRAAMIANHYATLSDLIQDIDNSNSVFIDTLKNS